MIRKNKVKKFNQFLRKDSYKKLQEHLRKTIKQRNIFEFPSKLISKNSLKHLDLNFRNNNNILPPLISSTKEKFFYFNKIKETMWNNKCESISEMNKQLYRSFKTSFDNLKKIK